MFPPGEARRQALAEELCSLANINPAILPFHFDNDDFARLCEAYDQICFKYPGIKRFTYGGKKADSRYLHDCDILDNVSID